MVVVNKLFITLSFIIFFILSSIYITLAEDDLQKSVEIARNAIKVQSLRMKVVAENLANEDSTASNPDQEPYRRKLIFARNQYDKKLKTNVVKLYKYGVDTKTPLKVKYNLGHPAADKDGFLLLPNVDKAIEKADSVEAQRSIEANLSVVEIFREMMQKTLEILK